MRYLPRWAWAVISLLSIPLGGVIYLSTGSLSALRTIGLTKTYGGSQMALQGVDLEVPAGSLYGLIGPNGAGKTTLLEILAGLRRPSAGEVDLGVSRATVAYCPDVAELEPWLTAREVLQVARSDCSGDAGAATSRTRSLSEWTWAMWPAGGWVGSRAG